MKKYDHVKDSLENLITELVESSLVEKREHDKNFRKAIEKTNKEIRIFSEIYLDAEKKEKFEEIKTLIYSNAREESEYLYIRGIKDGVFLLKQLGVIR